MTDIRLCAICADVREEDDQIWSETGHYICQTHRARVAALLGRIANYSTHLADPDMLARTHDNDAERWTGSKAPCDVHLISMTDRRTRHQAPGDPLSAERVLRAWRYAITETRTDVDLHDDPFPVRGVVHEARWLIGQLDWIAAYPAVIRLARHVAYVHNALRPHVR